MVFPHHCSAEPDAARKLRFHGIERTLDLLRSVVDTCVVRFRAPIHSVTLLVMFVVVFVVHTRSGSQTAPIYTTW